MEPAARSESSVEVEPSADVAETATLGPGTHIWHLAQVREEAQLGGGCIVGRGAYLGPGVLVGSNSKIQNYALVYEPATLGHGVFIGPGVILTNDRHPRAVGPDGARKGLMDWEPVGVVVLDGASIGAHSVCVASVRIGRWALIAAGSTVVRDVPDFALMAGSPARLIGWVGRSGAQLIRAEHAGAWVCPVTGTRFVEASHDRVVES